jgi:hypothetical protein
VEETKECLTEEPKVDPSSTDKEEKRLEIEIFGNELDAILERLPPFEAESSEIEFHFRESSLKPDKGRNITETFPPIPREFPRKPRKNIPVSSYLRHQLIL